MYKIINYRKNFVYSILINVQSNMNVTVRALNEQTGNSRAYFVI